MARHRQAVPRRDRVRRLTLGLGALTAAASITAGWLHPWTTSTAAASLTAPRPVTHTAASPSPHPSLPNQASFSITGHPVDVVYPGQRPSALIVLMSGVYQSLPGFEGQVASFAAQAPGRNWMVAYAGTTGAASWNAGLCCFTAVKTGQDDIAFLTSLIAKLRADYELDPATPVIMGGFSNGAMMAEEVACRAPSLAQGALLMGGNLQDPSCTSARLPDVLLIRGTGDKTVPIQGEQHSTYLRIPLQGDDATLRASTQGSMCTPLRKIHDGNVDLTDKRCSGSYVTYIAERGGHAWLTGDKQIAGNTVEETALMVTRLTDYERTHATG